LKTASAPALDIALFGFCLRSDVSDGPFADDSNIQPQFRCNRRQPNFSFLTNPGRAATMPKPVSKDRTPELNAEQERFQGSRMIAVALNGPTLISSRPSGHGSEDLRLALDFDCLCDASVAHFCCGYREAASHQG
jgi:hypothetical protein